MITQDNLKEMLESLGFNPIGGGGSIKKSLKASLILWR